MCLWPLRLRRWLRGGLAVACAATLAACTAREAMPSPQRESAYRENNRGVALLEQFKYDDAVTAFRAALQQEPSLGLARVNLAIALYYAQQLEAADAEATAAVSVVASDPHPVYLRALVARAQGRNDDAVRWLRAVLERDTEDVGTRVTLAQVYVEQERFAEAATLLEPVVAREPYHVTAAYVLGLALTRAGQTDRGLAQLTRAQALRHDSAAIAFGTGYLEQGKYAEAMASTGNEPEFVARDTPPTSWRPQSVPAPAGAHTHAGVTVLDANGDGRRDLVIVRDGTPQLVLQTSDGAFTEATAPAGFARAASASDGSRASMATDARDGAVAADYDNDGAADLVTFGSGRFALWHNDGQGHFEDVTTAAQLPPFAGTPTAVAFGDVDHDGDVDLIVAGEGTAGSAAPLLLLRNNRDGRFTDITAAAGLTRRGRAVAVVPMDYDNHRDLDLFVAYADGTAALFANQRDGTFRDIAQTTGLAAALAGAGTTTAVAVGDVNKDAWPDIIAVGDRGTALAVSDASGRFAARPVSQAARGVVAAQLLDYDNDGRLDLLSWSADGPRLLRGLGDAWADVTPTALASARGGAGVLANGTAVTIADIDDDGDLDLVTVAGTVTLWRSDGDPRAHVVRVTLHGRVSNRLGVGAKLQLRAGSLTSRAEVMATSPAVAPSDVLFGLGTRPAADVVRVIWPSGILQTETVSAPATATRVASQPIEELDRTPSSCPYLFTWDGTQFRFVTDFLGGGELGYWEGPGRYNHADPSEQVRIPASLLVPREGRLDLHVTNELEEVLYLDRLSLAAVAHPQDLAVYPNEGMTDPPKPSRLHVVRQPHPVPRATDDHGHDVTAAVATLDGHAPDDFGRRPIRGFADMHSVTIDLPDTRVPQTLLLTGWTDYAFSSDNVAAAQAGWPAQTPPILDRLDAEGRWHETRVAIGIPVGRPQTIPVDLTAVVRPGDRALRVRTDMRVYWDQLQFGETRPSSEARVVSLGTPTATLRERGYSDATSASGGRPSLPDFSRVVQDDRWKVMTGAYTRLGDVSPLLVAADDQFVVAKPGDDLSLSFAAPAEAVPAGWVRTWLLMGHGYSKEMDLHSASPDAVEPLPFHRMTRYPYPPDERRAASAPDAAARAAWQTRRVVRPWSSVPMAPQAARSARTPVE